VWGCLLPVADDGYENNIDGTGLVLMDWEIRSKGGVLDLAWCHGGKRGWGRGGGGHSPKGKKRIGVMAYREGGRRLSKA